MQKIFLVLFVLVLSACQSKQVIVPAVVHNVNTTKQEIIIEKAHVEIKIVIIIFEKTVDKKT